MNHYQPTKKVLLLSWFVAAASLSALSASLYLFNAKLSSVNAELDKVRSMSGSVGQAFIIRSEANDLDSEIKTLDSFFLPKGGEVAFIEKIESLAVAAGVKTSIGSISFDSKSSSDFKQDLRINLQAEGKRENLVSFLGLLEKSKQGIRIDSFDIESGSSGWSLNALLGAYELK